MGVWTKGQSGLALAGRQVADGYYSYHPAIKIIFVVAKLFIYFIYLFIFFGHKDIFTVWSSWMSVDVEEVNYIFMVCLYLKLKKHFLAIFGYSFWKCVAKLATVSKILARAQGLTYLKEK